MQNCHVARGRGIHSKDRGRLQFRFSRRRRKGSEIWCQERGRGRLEQRTLIIKAERIWGKKVCDKMFEHPRTERGGR